MDETTTISSINYLFENLHRRLKRIEGELFEKASKDAGCEMEQMDFENTYDKVKVFFEEMDEFLSGIPMMAHLFREEDELSEETEYPDRPPVAEVAQMTLEAMARYADPVCRKNISKDQFIEDQLRDFDADNWSQFKRWNTTSLGNLAYVALNAGNKAHQEMACQAIGCYRRYMNEVMGVNDH